MYALLGALHWDGPLRSAFASWKKSWGTGDKIGFPVAFQNEADSGKSVLYTVSGA